MYGRAGDRALAQRGETYWQTRRSQRAHCEVWITKGFVSEWVEGDGLSCFLNCKLTRTTTAGKTLVTVKAGYDRAGIGSDVDVCQADVGEYSETIRICTRSANISAVERESDDPGIDACTVR